MSRSILRMSTVYIYIYEHDGENQREGHLSEPVNVWKIPEMTEKEKKKRRIHIWMSCMCHLYDMVKRKKRNIQQR